MLRDYLTATQALLTHVAFATGTVLVAAVGAVTPLRALSEFDHRRLLSAGGNQKYHLYRCRRYKPDDISEPVQANG